MNHPHPRIKKAQEAHYNSLSFNEKIAVKISKAFSSISMFYALVAWQLIWIVLATLGIWAFTNDKYPFPFLLFLSNLIQLWALPILGLAAVIVGREGDHKTAEIFEDTEHIKILLMELLTRKSVVKPIVAPKKHARKRTRRV